MRSTFFSYIHGKLNFNSVMLNLGFIKFKYLVVLFLTITALTGIAQENPSATIRAFTQGGEITSGATTDKDEITFNIYLVFPWGFEAVTSDFTVGDLTVSGGVLSDFAYNSTYNYYEVKLTTSTQGNYTLDIDANKFNSGGYPNLAASRFSWTFDTTKPTMIITAANGSTAVADGATTNDRTLNLTFTSSEVTTNFASGDVSVSGGTLSSFVATSSTVYTGVFTPSGDGATTIDIAASTFTDAAGNNNTAATRFDWTYDGTKPTMIITATNGSTAVADGATTNDGTLTLTFTSSEVTTNFASGDVSVSGGTLSSFVATSSTVYTGVFTPSGDGATTIDIAASTFTDAAGNNNTAATRFDWTFDTTKPTMIITATNGSTAVADGATTNDGTLTLTFTSSEAITNFTSGSVTLSGGTLSSFSATSSSVFTGVFTPSTDGTTTIDIMAGIFADAAGNTNTAVPQFNWIYDGTKPTMTITATNGSTAVANDAITKDSTLTLTFTSSEVTTDFTAEDVTVSGGTLSDFAAMSTTVYTAKFTPSSSGATTIDVAANTFTDAAGNNNMATVQFNWTYDITPPTMTITASNGSNVVADSSRSQDTSLTVTFTSSEATTDFNADSINVIGGKLTDFSAKSATVYTATLTPSIDIDTVYHGGTFIEILGNKFTDAAGNNNLDTILFNWTYDIAGPSMRISAYRASNGVGVSNQGAANEDTLKIQFSSSEPTTDFTIEDIVVSGGVLSEFSGVGTTNYTATFVSSQEGAMSVAVAAIVFSDEAGNINTVAEPFGWTYDNTPPEMIIMAMTHGAQPGEFMNGSMTNDDSLFITFSFSEALMSFDRGDLKLINGDLSEIKSGEAAGGENLNYEAYLKPRGDGLVTIGIKKGALKDKAGNEVILFDSLSWTYDGTGPTMSLEVTNNGDVIIDGAVVNDGSKTVTFTSSEPTTDFTVDSIALMGGSLSDFIAVNDTMYTATFMPSAIGVNSIVVAENSFTDAVGNYNTGIAYYVSIGAATFGIHESLANAGGGGVTAAGEVSYTLGQLSKATLYDINESEDTLYVVQQGIQQPYEIAEILGMEETTISLSVVAYPNPTYEVLTLKIENYKNEQLTYQLHDLQGKLLDRNTVMGSSTTINMAGLSPNMYLLSISSDQSLIKTFRIIKN